MKISIIPLIVIALCPACISAPRSVTSAGRVIVPTRQLPMRSGEEAWPADEEIGACERALAYRLAKDGHELGDYYIRLGAEVRDGSRHIVGMAAHKGASGSAAYLRPPSDEVVLLSPFGGGEVYFSFDYDTQRRKLVAFGFNAAL